MYIYEQIEMIMYAISAHRQTSDWTTYGTIPLSLLQSERSHMGIKSRIYTDIHM